MHHMKLADIKSSKPVAICDRSALFHEDGLYQCSAHQDVGIRCLESSREIARMKEWV